MLSVFRPAVESEARWKAPAAWSESAADGGRGCDARVLAAREFDA